ncbi:DUF4270 domain-containing protein [Salinimicrobium terrae]|uniref:DUF4270 domain-containing protein n=1 Tax=Salinimicrobium terrae TaxID=470866 RepID=UPI0004152E20|nr:DUF4270 domain-containing protein [Salinimicrobium terrae]
MNLKNTMLRLATVVAAAFSLIACEDDFDAVGSSVIGEPGFNADLYDDALLTARSYDLPPVQTNNLPLNLLGVYSDEVFGIQEASVLSNLLLTTANPSFGTEPVIDSVVLAIPYFSHEIVEDEEVKYALDSIYGNSPIKLSVYESGYFLNTYDPESDFEEAQKYYSNLEPQIMSFANPDTLYENKSFIPSAEEREEYTVDAAGETDTVTMAPALRLKLDNNFFQSKIIDKAGSSDLLNQGNFRNYFRGLYLKADEIDNSGTMMLLDLLHPNAGITIYYRTKVIDATDADEDDDVEEMIEVRRSYTLRFGGVRVNTFEQEVPQFDSENLYLKGGEGSMAIIDLFSGPDANEDGVSDELEFLRENDWLINEAHLEFYVNRDYISDVNEAERVYLYDLENNSILADYILDTPGRPNQTSSGVNNRHLEPLKRDEDGNGISYKIRITNHIDKLLNRDSTNVKLGLVVTQNVNLISPYKVLPAANPEVESVPGGALLTPEATVLYGPNAENQDKRLKLNIYYTEPKN